MLGDRFHPLIANINGEGAEWWICDGHADTEHSLAIPYIEEPCKDYEEAVDLCATLNEDDQQGIEHE